MTAYTETLDRMAEKVGGQVLAALESWQAGRITEGEFVAVVAAFLTAADHRATALADTALAAYLSAATGRPSRPWATVPPELDHRPRIVELSAAGAAADQWHAYGRGSHAGTRPGCVQRGDERPRRSRLDPRPQHGRVQAVRRPRRTRPAR